MKEIIKEIKELFKKSIKDFLIKDGNMSLNCSERAKVHRIAHYLENYMQENQLFEGYVVDCEYNRVFIKNSSCIKKFPPHFFDDDKSHNDCFMPDLIVHKRNMQENLLYCEFKNKNESDIDNKKISLLTGGKFLIQYVLGATIILNELNINNYKEKICFKENKSGKNIYRKN